MINRRSVSEFDSDAEEEDLVIAEDDLRFLFQSDVSSGVGTPLAVLNPPPQVAEPPSVVDAAGAADADAGANACR